MRESIGEDTQARGKIDKMISGLVRRIIAETEAEKIILFGSYARGDWNESSDIDLVVVGDFKERFTERIVKLLGLNDTNMPLEVLAYTREEFNDMKKKGNQFISNVMKEGIVVYSRWP